MPSTNRSSDKFRQPGFESYPTIQFAEIVFGSPRSCAKQYLLNTSLNQARIEQLNFWESSFLIRQPQVDKDACGQQFYSADLNFCSSLFLQ